MVGEEKTMAILFVDLVNFTPFAESLPTYDVVHALNRYYQRMGRVIEKFGGTIDNYLGDGLLALFDNHDPRQSSMQAIKSALEIIDEIENLAEYFQPIYKNKLEIRIGLHCGNVVVGELGPPNDKHSSVVGDAVNFASRIEGANKVAGTTFLISNDTHQFVNEYVTVGKQITLPIKGKQGEHTLFEVVAMRDD